MHIPRACHRTACHTAVTAAAIASTFTSAAPTATAAAVSASIHLPAVGAGWDYQLGGAYTPPSGVTVVGRDRTATPAKLGYDICYVNGFQTQDGEKSLWPAAALLKTSSGALVSDPDWPGEYILDTRTAASRAAIFSVVQPWIAGCAAAGYHAVDIDNLDTYTRFSQLSQAGNYALASMFINEAHAHGLAAAQKNDAESCALGKSTGFDFAVAEECAYNNECSSYTDVYSVVLGIEYSSDVSASTFKDSYCKAADRPSSLIYRDVDLVAKGKSGYLYTPCQ